MFDKLFEQKWFYVILSLLLAFVFWFYVRGVEDPIQSTMLRDVPVVLVGENILENQNLTISAISHSTVDLDIQTNLSVLTKLNNRNVSVTVDVSRCAGEGDYQLSYSVSYPSTVNSGNISVNGRTPEQVTVTVNRLYTEVFNVEFVLRGSVAEGYQAGQATVSPESVSVSGAAEQVSKISRVVAVLERQELSERFSGTLPLTLEDAQGNVLTDLEVKLSATAAYVTLPVVVVEQIPLTVNIIPGGGATEENIEVSITPESIIVSGAKEDMLPLKEISLGSIDLAKVNGIGIFTFPINLDVALENVSGIAEATVEVRVSGLHTRVLNVTNIELTNIPAEYNAVSETLMRTIILRGNEEALALIDPSQVRIVADLSKITALGSTQVQAKVYLDAGNEVGVVGDYSITVTVSRAGG